MAHAARIALAAAATLCVAGAAFAQDAGDAPFQGASVDALPYEGASRAVAREGDAADDALAGVRAHTQAQAERLDALATAAGRTTTGRIGERRVEATTARIGADAFLSGYVGAERVQAHTRSLGETSFTTGFQGDQALTATTTQVGDTAFTNGMIGGERVSTTTTCAGGSCVTTGYVGDRMVTTTTPQY